MKIAGSISSVVLFILFSLAWGPVEGMGLFRALTGLVFGSASKVQPTPYAKLVNQLKKTCSRRLTDANLKALYDASEEYLVEYEAYPWSTGEDDNSKIIRGMDRFLSEISILHQDAVACKKKRGDRCHSKKPGAVQGTLQVIIDTLEETKNRIMERAKAKLMEYDGMHLFTEMPDFSMPKNFIATKGPWFTLIPLVEQVEFMKKYACLVVFGNSACMGKKPYGEQFPLEMQNLLATRQENLKLFVQRVQIWLETTATKCRSKEQDAKKHWINSLPYINQMAARLRKVQRALGNTLAEMKRKPTLKEKMWRRVTGG